MKTPIFPVSVHCADSAIKNAERLSASLVAPIPRAAENLRLTLISSYRESCPLRAKHITGRDTSVDVPVMSRRQTSVSKATCLKESVVQKQGGGTDGKDYYL